MKPNVIALSALRENVLEKFIRIRRVIFEMKLSVIGLFISDWFSTD